MKISIDTELCTGHGRCYEVAPELFTDDESGYGKVIAGDIGPSDLEAAELAIRTCPERAISLSD